ncbi:MAG: ISKra4 family transposase [Ktedonobacteraceae bacterium]
MERARPVGSGFSPLDEELGLLAGRVTPRQQEHLVHLATWMPFARAAEMLQRVLGVQLSEATVRRLTEQAGAQYEQLQTIQSRCPEPEMPASAGPLKEVISTDGAYVPLVNGTWAEVRTVAIGDVERHIPATGPSRVKVTHLSYFSRMTDAQSFEQLAEGELRRRRVRDAQAICAVSDGALWLQSFIDLHRPDAVRILDFPHAAEYVSAIGEVVRAKGGRLPARWLDGVLHRLKHEGPDRILRHLSHLCERWQDPEAEKKLRYLSARQSLMQYPRYQAAGWPIGSGMVESANKLVMQARLKGAGMRWEPHHVNPMLALRDAVCNDRWDEAWQDLSHHQHRQRHARRVARASARLTALTSGVMLTLLRARPHPLPPPPCAPRPCTPAATLPGSSRPSPHHPWKRGPACRPKLGAKM